MNSQVNQEKLGALKDKLRRAVESGEVKVEAQDQIMDPEPGLFEQEPSDKGILKLELTPDALIRLGGLGTTKLVVRIDRE